MAPMMMSSHRVTSCCFRSRGKGKGKGKGKGMHCILLNRKEIRYLVHLFPRLDPNFFFR